MDGAQWRRSVVADRDGELVGRATVATRRVHAGRLAAAIEVAPESRRAGTGSRLLAAVRDHAGRHDPQRRPLSFTVAAGSPGAAFLFSAGGKAFQECPGFRIDPADPDVRRWAASFTDASVEAMTGMPDDTVANWFVEFYLWTHRTWSPVVDVEPLRSAALADLDRHRSSVVFSRGAPAAFAFVYGMPDGGTELVGETAGPHTPDADEALAAAVARSLRLAGGPVDVDSHVSDPHLHPLLSALPARRESMLLMELRP